MPPSTTLWPIGPHTPAKHRILRSYLNAWLPIMAFSRQGRVLFVDGFAGPGKYSGGEDGSPIVAIRALLEQRPDVRSKARVTYLFVEENAGRAVHLEETVAPLRTSLPDGCEAHVHRGAFDETINGVLDHLGASGDKLAPCFVMVDPFGVSGIPMRGLARILANPKSELYISFMYEAINRHKETGEFAPHLDELFGTEEWRDGVDMPESDHRRQFFYELYSRQLKRAGATHVLWFELFNGNRHVYTVFFATRHLLGCDRMKEAMWRVAPDGAFEFRGSHSGQLSLTELMGANLERLKGELRREFGGATDVPIEAIQNWIASDQTDFYSAHLKKTLKEMESAGEVTARSATPKPRKRGSYPDGTLVSIRAGI
jgi:hypothetical protein